MAKALAAALVLFAISYGMPALAQQIFTVDRLSDTGQGQGLAGDLRYCITNATDGDSITFTVTGTINLTRPLPYLTRSIIIEGPGANLLTVRPTGGNYGAFAVISVTVRISGLTITGGRSTAGGAIYNTGNLAVDACTISGNSAEACGGGVYNQGTLTISNSTISGNRAGFGLNEYSVGGGVCNDGILTISNSTISGNSAIATVCDLTCEDVGIGGGVSHGLGSLTISNSTISGNYANYDGGGIAGYFSMRNSILAGNSDPGNAPDLGGTLSSSGYNLIGNTRGGSGFDPTDLLNVDPMLGPLQDNGGPTFTHALMTGSPALDAGDPNFIGPPDFDQRGEGFPRVVNGLDIGAFEVQGGA